MLKNLNTRGKNAGGFSQPKLAASVTQALCKCVMPKNVGISTF